MYKSERTEIQQMKYTKWIPRRMGSLLCFQCGSCKFSFVSSKVGNSSFKYCPHCGDNMVENSSVLNERSVKSMYEKLREKLEKAAEDYADLLIKRIEVANKELDSGILSTNAEPLIKVDEAMRMAMYMANTLERFDRPNRGNETDGLND